MPYTLNNALDSSSFLFLIFQLVLAVLFLFKLVWALGRRLYVLDREMLLLLLPLLPPRWIMLDTKLWARDLVDDAPIYIY